MPRKLLSGDAIPTLVHERLTIWGRSIHAQRQRQRIPAVDLCARLGVSEGTLRRLERGDPGVAAGSYLAALLTLGVLDLAAPPLAPELWANDPGRRVKLRHDERAMSRDDPEYF